MSKAAALEKQKRLNAQEETEQTKAQLEKVRRESAQHESSAKEIKKKLEEKTKDLTRTQTKQKKEVRRLEEELERKKLLFDINTIELQRNCEHLLCAFQQNCTQDRENAVAQAMEIENAEKLRQMRRHGVEMRRLQSEVFLAKRDADATAASALELAM